MVKKKYKHSSPSAIECEISRIPQMTCQERWNLLTDLVMRGTKRLLKKKEILENKKGHLVA